MTIDKILDDKKSAAYSKYLIVSKIFSDFKYKESKEYMLAFKDKLDNISRVLEIPSLDPGVVKDEMIAKIVEETSHKHHPVTFSDKELEAMIRKRIA